MLGKTIPTGIRMNWITSITVFLKSILTRLIAAYHRGHLKKGCNLCNQ